MHAHRVAITLEAVHAVEALEAAFACYGLPQIVNTDQGSQFATNAFTEAVLSRGIRIRWTAKEAGVMTCSSSGSQYEGVYLKAYASINHAQRSLGNYIELYNRKRPHSSLADRAPDEAILRHSASNQISSMIASNVLLINLKKLSERARLPLITRPPAFLPARR